ncbi:unnamed protein product [Albugo candida]|uniref:Uncharacterized protein n=1 Tax=Albugo candida TaxID=65357 RepID=A0A024FUQ2_9STRA|nr:unnamed protein product [Albugo candida]|eukprot:CCI10771.1 unnamed protein product [Albugo candida]
MEMERSQAINELESKLKATNGTILFHKTQWTRSNKRVKATQSLNELNATKPKMDLAHSHNALLEKEEQLKTASAAVGHLHLENESLKRKLGGEIAQTDASQLIPSTDISPLITEKVELETIVGRYVHMAEAKLYRVIKSSIVLNISNETFQFASFPHFIESITSNGYEHGTIEFNKSKIQNAICIYGRWRNETTSFHATAFAISLGSVH